MGEEDGAMTVSFEVDSTVKLSRGVMEMLDTSRGADNRETEGPGNVGCGGAVGICGLHHTNSKFGQTGSLDKVCNEGGGEGGNLVPIEEAESTVSIVKVVDDSVSVTVE